MATLITRGLFKNSEDFDRYSCLSCSQLLNQDPVQLACGHRLCRSCAEKLIATAKKVDVTPKFLDTDCNEELSDEDGAYYFPDRFVQQEILNVICPFGEFGCNWEGRFEDYPPHVKSCDFAMTACEYCEEKLLKNQITAHSQACPKAPKECPLSALGCTMPATSKDNLKQHMEKSASEHSVILAKKMQSLDDKVEQRKLNDDKIEEIAMRKDFVDADGAISSSQHCDSGVINGPQSSLPLLQRKTQVCIQNKEATLDLEENIRTIIESLTKLQGELKRKATVAELRAKHELNQSVRLTSDHCASLLQQLSPHVSKWYDIGINLGFKCDELNNIKAKPLLLADSPDSWLSQMLSQWLQWAPGDARGSTDFATLEALRSALRQSNLGAAAYDLH